MGQKEPQPAPSKYAPSSGFDQGSIKSYGITKKPSYNNIIKPPPPPPPPPKK